MRRWTCVAVLMLVGTSSARAADEWPNIIVIVADDLGYADVGFHGCRDIPTPNLDRLAAGGVRFTDGYVSCPVCSPTRAGLNTGRYQQRFGHEFNPGPAGAVLGQSNENAVGLPTSETMLPAQMKSAGYVTGMVGKWHLGYAPQYYPTARGFDEFFGFLGGGHSYTRLGPQGIGESILRGTTEVDELEYLTDAFGREAAAFVERHARDRFYLYLTFNAVHTPLEATDKYLARFPSLTGKRQTYAAMLSAMDDNIGRVLDAVRAADLERNTLIFFVSDNGGPPTANGSRNDPLNGAKGSVWEGGIRVPFVVRWPGTLQEGATFSQPVIALDIFATATAIAGAKQPADRPLDGVNLLPALTGQETRAPHDALYWRSGPKQAVRQGGWKLLNQGAGGGWELYNLREDIGETKNRAADEPERVKQLAALYGTWDAQLAKPLWGSRNAGDGEQPRKSRKRSKK